MKISKIIAREVLDSRGYPTLKTSIVLADGTTASAQVPSGASTGVHEALELRDKEKRFFGKGVLKAIENIALIEKKLKNLNVFDQERLDKTMCELDGTPNKSKLGANAILSVSLAAARVASIAARMPLYKYLRETCNLKEKEYILPCPMLNIINGGVHADSGLNIQEFMIVPTKQKTFKEALQAASEVYHTLKNLLAQNNLSTSIGDEGGFAPKIKKHEEVFRLLLKATAKAGYPNMPFAIDCAASEFYEEAFYYFEGKKLSYKELSDIYSNFAVNFPIISIEDPFEQDDWQAWEYFTQKEGKKLNIVGDDLFVTNFDRVELGIERKAANSVLIKLNQIGTLSETIKVIYKAKRSGLSTIISHRSGETEDSFIADLAVAVNSGAIKSGAPARSERLAKYNRLLEIEAELAGKAIFAKDKVFKKK
ncbi:MAG: phosphopyruvate hydratase [Elusimicrobiaceae bacterium]|nr:phosphopyruvate hydratase [Elusimicrobiaceae bacterium]